MLIRHQIFTLLLCYLFGSGLAACTSSVQDAIFADPSSPMHGTVDIPLGGNSWTQGSLKLSAEGITEWTNAKDRFSTWFSVDQAGSITLSLYGHTYGGTSQLRLSVQGQSQIITMQADTLQASPTVTFELPEASYVEVRVEGISKTGDTFGDFWALRVSGSPINEATAFVPDNQDNAFYWTRRGPSVHLRYDTDPRDDVEWYYGEIEVPEGNDVIGSYFMAHGFNGGYFGFQVNSEHERRILFSIWSPFQTDNPKDIPEEDRIKLYAKGQEVYTGEFGNEGSGGQSYLRYMWSAGLTYKFLLQGQPLGNNYTRYTAWFYASDDQEWRLIASWDRPKTDAYLKGWYSFLENFRPDTGPITRMAYYKNQWYLPANSSTWKEATQARFTADNTARSNWRSDYAGGSAGQAFFMRNCGFFYPPTPFDQDFAREAAHQPPAIDLQGLPME